VIRAAAKLVRVKQEQSVFSYLGINFRKRLNQECVRSTTHRHALNSGLIAISFFSSPRGRICGMKPLPWATSSLPTYPASRHKWHSVVVGGETTVALSKVSRATLSCWLAALTSSEMGMPFSSTRICHFEPFFPDPSGLDQWTLWTAVLRCSHYLLLAKSKRSLVARRIRPDLAAKFWSTHRQYSIAGTCREVLRNSSHQIFHGARHSK